jgi:hypothetical protein
MSRARPILFLAAICLGQAASPAQPASSPPPAKPTTPTNPATPTKPAPSPLSIQAVSAELDSTLKALTDDGNYTAAIARAQAIFDRLVAYGDPRTDAPAFRASARWLRLFRQLEKLPDERQAASLKSLRAHDRLAAVLARVVKKEDNLSKVYTFINLLADKRAGSLDRFAELAVAVAVVHDAPLAYERALSPAPLEIYDYFVGIDGRATLAPSALPAELLIHVVDTAATTDELWWALNKYPNDRQPGRHFFEIQYDKDNFKRNKPLKLDKYDFTLQNIRKIGGVCRHQAYYAAQVSKAVGIPSVVDSARGADVGHAWVGYLDITGPTCRWNFDEGRYDEYKGLMGSVPDPQTRRVIPDSQVALLAQFYSEPTDNRLLAAALTDAAIRLGDFAPSAAHGTPTVREGPASPKRKDQTRATPNPASPALAGPTVTTAGAPADSEPPAPASKERASASVYPPTITWPDAKAHPARPATITSRLTLLEQAINVSPARQDAWLTVADLAKRQELNHDQLVHWSEAAVAFCGTAYPDFALDVLKPMFKSVKDPAEQDRLYDWAYDKFFKGVSDQKRRRVDLAAMIRFEQGRLWEEAGQPDRAWTRYKQIIAEFPNDGPFIVTAVERCAAMLKKHDKPVTEAISLYQDEFTSQSNWFRVGNAYETLLRDAGRANEADRVRAQFRKEQDAGG